MAKALNGKRIAFDILSQNKQYEEQFDWQVGDDDYHLSLYPEINPPARSTAPEILNDSNCIFVSNSTGSDTYDGSENVGAGTPPTTGPYKTIEEAIKTFFQQTTRVKKYICLKDDYIYVEDIQIPKWLDGYIYSDGTDDPRIRRVERTIPIGCTDSNTKWVDIASGNDSTGSGTRASPYKTIYKALSDITTTAFTYVAIKVSDSNYTTEEMTWWTPSSTITQTVTIFAYMSSDGTEMKAGKSLTHSFKAFWNSTNGTSNISKDTSLTKGQMIVSRNFSASGEEELIFVQQNTNTKAISRTEDFKTFTDLASTSTKDWIGLCEYYYNGHWYLLALTEDAGSNMRIFWYRDDGGANKGEYQISLSSTASTNDRDTYMVSDGKTAFFCCADASDYFIYELPPDTDPTSSSGWNKIYTGSNRVYLTCTDSQEFYWCERGSFSHSNNTIYKYNNGGYDEIELDRDFYGLFKYGNTLYGVHRENSGDDYIYSITMTAEGNFSIFASALYSTGSSHYFMGWYTFNELVYLCIYVGGDFYITKFKGNSYTAVGRISGNSGVLRGYFNKVFKGCCTGYEQLTGPNKRIGICTISNVVSYHGKIKFEGIIFDNQNIGNCVSSNEHSYLKYCQCKDADYGLYISGDQQGDILNTFFNEVDYPILYESLIDSTIKYCLFVNFIYAIYFKTFLKTYGDAMQASILHNTINNGEVGVKVDVRQDDTTWTVKNTIFNKTSYPIYAKKDLIVRILYCLLYPYGTNIGDTISDDNYNTIPLFYDSENNDYRLQSQKLIASNGEYFKYNSSGIGLADDTKTPTYRNGRNYKWSYYFDIIDFNIGAFSTLTPLFRDIVWETLEIENTPSNVQPVIQQKKTALLTAIDGTTYKKEPVKKRLFNYNFDPTPSQDKIFEDIGTIELLLVQKNPFKLFTSPLLDFENLGVYSSSSEYTNSDMYIYISNGIVGWYSGVFSIANMVMDIGRSIPQDLYKGLFIKIYKEPSSYPGDLTVYEYRISNNTSGGLLSLSDYWGIGDIPDGSYASIIAYALVLHDIQDLNIGNNIYNGFNLINEDDPLLGSLSLRLVEV